MFKNIKTKLDTYRWFVWGILALAYVIVFFHRVAAGVVRDELIQSFRISDAEFGNLGSMYFYAYMLMQIPSGILADTLGARKTVTIGTLLAGMGSILFGLANTIAIAYIGRFIVGLGVSVVFISILKVLSQWFKEDEFGRMSGITSFIGNGGSLLAQFPLVVLVAAIGWKTSFGVIGLVTIFIAVLAYIIVRNTPEEMGFEPLVKKEGKGTISLTRSIKIVFTNPRTWPGFLVFGGMFGSIIAFMGTWGVPYIKDIYSLDKGRASTFVMTMTLGLMIGSILVGMISDKLRKRKLPVVIASILYFMGWLLLMYVNPGRLSLGLLYGLMFSMGLFSSGFVLSWAASKEVNPPEYAGISTGTVNMGGFLFAAVIQTLIGYILKASSSVTMIDGVRTYPIALYNKGFLVCLAAAGIGVIGALLLKETKCQNTYQK